MGAKSGEEYEVACQIREELSKLWPLASKKPKSDAHIVIVAGAKIFGQEVSDIDVVVAVYFKSAQKFMPNKPLSSKEGVVPKGKAVQVSSFIAAVEVKSHPSEKVTISGHNILVPYKDKSHLHNATEQNVKQMHALSKYLKYRLKIDNDVWVTKVIVMRGFQSILVEGALPNKFTAKDFLTELCATSPVNKSAAQYYVSGPHAFDMQRILDLDLFKEYQLGSLDRFRMDLISSQSSIVPSIVDGVGNKLIRIRGRGGSGKTIMLLNAAWNIASQRGSRIVVLTYNNALSIDIKRLLGMLSIPSDDEFGIKVETVMGFLMRWFKAFGVTGENNNDLNHYSENLKAASALFKGDALQDEDISTIKLEQSEKFDFDYVFIDEAQDWPIEEIELIKRLYGVNNLLVADGVDQIIRSGSARNWLKGLATHEYENIEVKKCLRMKKNLASFANSVAYKAQVNWQLIPNNNAPGGRVIVTSSNDGESLLATIVESIKKAKSDGNSEIDCLICIPPGNLVSENNDRVSLLGNVLLRNKIKFWDGTRSELRQEPLKNIDKVRLVQYASVRGLEGWSVILHELDELWSFEYSKALNDATFVVDEGLNRDLYAKEKAWKSVLIALTRPMDQLVISIKNPESEVGRVLSRVASNFPDYISVN